MKEEKEEKEEKEKKTAGSSPQDKEEIHSYKYFLHRCCGMCGAGLSGNPCWKEDDEERE